MEFFVIIVASVFYIIVTIAEIRKYRRQAPNGKVFTRKFSDLISAICRASEYDKAKSSLETVVNNKTFKVQVLTELTCKSLKYDTIPTYKSYLIYINEELVCREHILSLDYKEEKVYFEFSFKRELNEIVEIITSAAMEAKKINTAHFNKLLNSDKQSFFINTEEDK